MTLTVLIDLIAHYKYTEMYMMTMDSDQHHLHHLMHLYTRLLYVILSKYISSMYICEVLSGLVD